MGSSPLTFPGIDAAIAQFEGFGKAGSIATVNNNPGNLMYGTFAQQHGATGYVLTPGGNIATFPDVGTGSAAEDALVNNYATKGATLNDLINAWAPPTAPGNSNAATQNYAAYVANSLGVDPTTSVSSLAGVGGSTTPGTPSSLASTILNSIQSFLSLGYGNAFPLMNQTGLLTYSRIGAFLLGLILIAGGIYLFKPVQQGVSVVVRTGKKIATAAGEVAAAT
jgi:hypothetical protein